MEKNGNMKEIINDLTAKRDALSLAHEQLKKDNDDWNKCIIVLSLLTGMVESAKIKLNWDNAVVTLLPIVMSSVIASISALIKFKKFPEQMEILIQSISILTNTLNKCRNNNELDKDILFDYNLAIEKLETCIYPDIRKQYLKTAHRNLIQIMQIEQKYKKNIELVHKGMKADNTTISEETTNTEENKMNLNTQRILEEMIDKGEEYQKIEIISSHTN